MAPGVAVVNPKRGGDERLAPLAGVGVAFKLMHALVKTLRERGIEAARRVDLREYLDLVAVGTVADVALLTGENRILVRAGLERLNRMPSLGLRSLMRRAGIRPPVDARQLGFVIGPRLNAAGRLADVGPEESLALLLAVSAADADPVAERLEKANETRRRIEETVLNEALRQTDARSASPAIVVAGEGWHVGTIGIVAARLCARFGCPAAVIAWDDADQGKGSCRSTEGVNVVEALGSCDDLLEAFGGHAMAAGFRVRRERLAELTEGFRAACAEQIRRAPRERVLRLDGWLTGVEADLALVEGLGNCEPFGPGNREPVWGMREATVTGPVRVVGERHLRFGARTDDGTYAAIGFGMAESGIAEGMKLDLAFRLRRDPYAGPDALQLQIEAVRPGTSQPS
jgi:single-stranded-DNA-specific exonuclease